MSNVSSSSGEQALGGGADSGSGVAVGHSHGLSHSHSLARRASSPTPTTPLTGVTSISSRPPSIAGSLALTDDSTRVVTGGASSSHPLQHYSTSSHQLNLENMHRQPASLTARNLGRIPDADEVAPGIRLPNEGVDDAHHHDHHHEHEHEHEQREQEQERAEHQDAVGDSRLQKHPDGDASSPERSRERERFDRRGTINANFRNSSAHDAPLSDGTPLGSEAGAGDADRDERAYVGHYGEGGAPVAGVPPELDPRTSKFRPPSPAASVFSVAVQAPGSPKPEVLDSEAVHPFSSGSVEDAEPLSPAFELAPNIALPTVTSSNNSVHALGQGTSSIPAAALPGQNLLRRSSLATSASISGATAGSNSRPVSPIPSLGISPPGTPSFPPGPGGHVGLGGLNLRNRSALGALVSQAPSEYGSASSEGGQDAPLGSSGTGGGAESASRAVSIGTPVHSSSVHAGMGGRDEASIEALRMREREIAGGEVGVGGLHASHRPIFNPGLAALRDGNVNARRAGSTAATVGTASPAPSLGGVSEPPDATDDAPSRRNSNESMRSAETLASFRPPSRGAVSASSDGGLARGGAARKEEAKQVDDSKRGALIVVEGLDRAGKSTQVERLVKALDARLVKFPDRTTPIGRMLDSYLTQKSELDDRAVHLLFSANRWELAPSIRQDLEAGKTVICDRYAFSGIAYSTAKGLPFDWCLAPDATLPAPDLTIFLTISPSVAAERGGYGAERYEDREMQLKVKSVFEDVEDRVGDWMTVDADRSVEEVWKDVEKAAKNAVGLVTGPVRGLFD